MHPKLFLFFPSDIQEQVEALALALYHYVVKKRHIIFDTSIQSWTAETTSVFNMQFGQQVYNIVGPSTDGKKLNWKRQYPADGFLVKEWSNTSLKTALEKNFEF